MKNIFISTNRILSTSKLCFRYCYLRCHSSSQNKLKKLREPEYDIVVIGGGIVGTASARELLKRNPNCKLALLEKESELGHHQSGHNSGVVHAGIYYQPGSLKAKLCVEGLDLSYKYFEKEGIPYKKCGKLIVATEEKEIEPLMNLYERARQNSASGVQLVDAEAIGQIEPFCKGVKALWSPNTGIVDWKLVTKHYGKNIKEMSGDIYFNFQVKDFSYSSEGQILSKSKLDYPIRIIGQDNKVVRARFVLVCGGLYSDRLASLSGCPTQPLVVPFRGEYLVLRPERNYLVKGNIYPVPDPRLPFLGVHFTPRMNGDILIGPNAVLAFSREGYKWTDFVWKDFLETSKYKGFQSLAKNHLSFGLKEVIYSIFPRLTVRKLQRFIPEITIHDIYPGPAGVRAQALSLEGNLVDEFIFQKGSGMGIGSRILHCRNAPSPAATSSLAIAKMVADTFHREFEL